MAFDLGFHQRDWRRPRLGLVAGALILWAAACGDPAVDRFNEQSTVGNTRLGNDGRVAVAFEGAALERIDIESGFATIDVRAAAPFPSSTVDNGTIDPQFLLFRIANVDPHAVFRTTLSELRDGARRDNRCDDLELADPPDTLLAPPTNLNIDDDGRPASPVILFVVTPPCASLRLTPFPADPDQFRIAVIGATLGDVDQQRDAMSAAVEAGAQHIHFLGHIADTTANRGFARTRETLHGRGLTTSVTPSRRDIRRPEHHTSFVETFGPTDFVSRIGAVRVLMLNTSLGRVSDRQFDLLDRALSSEAPGIAFLDRPPFDPAGVQREGLRSHEQASRLAGALVRGGFTEIVTPSNASASHAGPAYRTHRVAASDANAMTLITIDRVVPHPPTCVSTTDCVGERVCHRGLCRDACNDATTCPLPSETCREGVCLRSCALDRDCVGPRPECGPAGVCLDEPVLRFETIHY